MKIHISESNSKLGKIPNMSFPPIKSCQPRLPCYDDCYADRPYQRWKNVEKAWDENFEIWRQSPAQFWSEVGEWFFDNKPSHFRFFVGGDMPDGSFLYQLQNCVDVNTDTQFMMFTKNFKAVREIYRPQPNKQTILSMWPGLEAPKDLPNFRRAWLEDDVRKPEEYFHCSGKCDSCYSCWEYANHDVVLPRH